MLVAIEGRGYKEASAILDVPLTHSALAPVEGARSDA
jgi:hypothetical protein